MDTNKTCKVFGRCGACSQLNVPYNEQLACKDSKIGNMFAAFGSDVELHPILGMQDPYSYRDKIIAPFVPAKSSKIVSGMYAKGTHKVIESDGCLLENDLGAKVVAAIKQIMQRHGIPAYNEDKGSGFLRHAVIRVGHESGEVLVTLVTNSDEFPHSKSFCRELVRRVPEITTVVQSVNERQTNVVMGNKERVLYGPGFILDRLCGLSFRISPSSFYQVNSAQTQVLYEEAIKLAGLDGSQIAIDAYCGTGTIGLVAAVNGAKAVIGVDEVESAIRDAKLNARHNGIDNACFIAMDAEKLMRQLASGDMGALLNASEEGAAIAEMFRTSPKVLFMDPPRAGSTPRFLEAAASLQPERIVYISCNPDTQLRDVEQLAELGYALKVVQPVDMFPHTPHIENIALLERME